MLSSFLPSDFAYSNDDFKDIAKLLGIETVTGKANKTPAAGFLAA